MHLLPISFCLFLEKYLLESFWLRLGLGCSICRTFSLSVWDLQLQHCVFSCNAGGSQSLTRHQMQLPLHWELRVLTIGSPGKSWDSCLSVVAVYFANNFSHSLLCLIGKSWDSCLSVVAVLYPLDTSPLRDVYFANNFFQFLYFLLDSAFFFFFDCIILVVAHGISSPWPGIEPQNPALGAAQA